MGVLAVNYDLVSPGQKWGLIDAAMKQLGAHRVLQSCWFMADRLTPEQVMSQIAHAIDCDDRVIISPVTLPMRVNGIEQSEIDWLNRNL